MRVRAVAVACALLLGGCGVTDQRVADEHASLAESAANTVCADLEGALGQLHEAGAHAESVLAAHGATPADRFEALDALRRASGVDGLLWEDPGGGRAWAGRTVEPLSLPPPLPWHASFRVRDLTVHLGPYVRALVAGPLPVGGGMLTATVVLEEQSPDHGPWRPFRQRWLDPLGVERVVLGAPGTVAAGAGDADFSAAGPDGHTLVEGVVTPPGSRALRDRLEQEAAGRAGWLWLALWLFTLVAVLTGLVRGRAQAGAGRWLLAGLVLLAARTALGLLSLPERFPSLRQAFDPSDFGISDPLGWLASPADFALTAVVCLLAAVCFARAVRRIRIPGPRSLDALALIVGVGGAAGVAALHVAVVEVAVAQGQTEFFAVPTIIPSLPAALLLLGLVADTAAAWILVVASLRVAVSGSPRLAVLPWMTLPALAASGLALALTHGSGVAWAAPLLPLASLLAYLPTAGGEPPPLPTRVLLVGVLATILLFPLLWTRVGERRTRDLVAALDELVRSEVTALGTTFLDADTLRSDPDLRAALDAARSGPAPEGLALGIWLRSALAGPEARGVVHVLDPQGRLLDGFTLSPLPLDRLPRPVPPADGEGDLQVTTARGDGNRLRCVVGRLTLRDDAEAPLGHVVLTVPDAVDLALHGLAAPPRTRGSAGSVGSPWVYAIVRGGRVTASSDPSVSRAPLAFGPPALATLGPGAPELAWSTPQEDGYARWSWERGEVIAVRRRAAGVGDAVLALARLVVVGVGLAGLAALVLALITSHRLRRRLHHRILLSYFAISFVPLVVLGWASANDARARHDAFLSQRLEADIGRVRSDLEAMGGQLFDHASDARLAKWSALRGHDVLLYRDGLVSAASRSGLVEAEVIPARLSPDAYRATALEEREIVRREDSFAGRPVWFGCAPIQSGDGRTVATVGVPLLYDTDRAEERFAVTGSVLLAAWLLTLVLVLVGGIWAARRLARPLGLLAVGTRRVAAGELDVELEATGSDELGELVQAFNSMTREVRRAQARAVTAEREMAWRRMARQVAHEIKNPLTPIRLMIQQMEASIARDPGGAVDAIRRTAPVVLKQIETLGRIASDFSAFARMPVRHPSDVDVRQVATDVVALYAGSAEDGVDVAGEIGSDLPSVRWDAEELRRALVNVVGNAVQAIDGPGRVTLRVQAEAHEGHAGVRVEVADTGVGIRPEDLERLFEPDFSTKTDGTGLGLAMVRRTIDDLGGTIDVASVRGGGTTFTMWWPASAAPDT